MSFRAGTALGQLQALFLVFTFVFSTGLAGCATLKGPGTRKKRAQIHYDIGIVNLNRGDRRMALKELLMALEYDEVLPEAHFALGLIYHAMERQELGLRHYTRALELRSGYSEVHNNIGILYMDMGKYDNAIESFELALGDILYATPYLAEGNLGWAYYKQGESKKAIRHIMKALDINKRFCRGYEWLVRIALAEENPALATSMHIRLEKYCLGDALVAENVSAEYIRELQYYYGLAFLKQGKRENAQQLFKKCASDNPESTFGLKCSASVYVKP
jgi:type IV pilus assembly protein PilF